MEQRQEFSGVFGDLSRDVLIVLESEQDELLNILNNLGLPQIIYTDASEKRECLTLIGQLVRIPSSDWSEFLIVIGQSVRYYTMIV